MTSPNLPGEIDNHKDTANLLSVGLVSGMVLHIEAIFLYPEEQIALARSLQAKATRGLGGASSPIGFLGSPDWVIGGAIVTGILESVASKSAASTAKDQLTQAQVAMSEARSGALFIPVADITDIESPYPERWAFTAHKERIVERPFNVKVETHTARMIHNGAPYVVARTTEGECISIAWDKVETYQAISSRKR